MNDQPLRPDPNNEACDDNRASSTGDTTPGTPQWVRFTVVIVVALILLFVILHLTGNSPGVHTAP